MLLRCCLALVALAACCVAPRAWAAGSGDNCTVLVTGVNFGTYDPTSGLAVAGQGQFQIDCNKNDTEVLISLSTGTSGGSYASRRMTNGSDFLNYNLYLEPAHTTVFGNGTNGSSTVMCKTGQGNNQNGCTGSNPSGSGRRTVRPFYGLMPASQNVGPGAYVDTITYMITF